MFRAYIYKIQPLLSFVKVDAKHLSAQKLCLKIWDIKDLYAALDLLKLNYAEMLAPRRPTELSAALKTRVGTFFWTCR